MPEITHLDTQESAIYDAHAKTLQALIRTRYPSTPTILHLNLSERWDGPLPSDRRVVIELRLEGENGLSRTWRREFRGDIARMAALGRFVGGLVV